MGRRRIYHTEEEIREARRKCAEKYNRSEKGRKYHQEYFKELYATSEGRKKILDRSNTYHQTEEGKSAWQKADKKHKCKIYGLTVDEYDALFLKQDGKCAICERAQEERLCIDHDHKTGKVRGLLCHRCNRVLGSVYDNDELLQRFINYLVETANGRA